MTVLIDRKDKTLKRLDGMIRRERATLATLEKDAAATLRAQRERIRDLVSTRDTLEPKRRRPRKASELDAHAQAGLDNVLRMEAVFANERVCSQATAAREAEVQSGTGTWAIRALLEDGAIVATGEMEGVSKVYRYVGKRRRTRLRPGEGT